MSKNYILVDSEKENRAKVILALCAGKKSPADDHEQERKEKFTQILAEAKIDVNNVDAVKFVYEKLGGLVRTPLQQKVAEEKKEDIQAKKGAKIDK